MKTKNKNKVAWITAASSNFGKTIAKLLIKNGYVVYAADNRSKNLIDLKLLGANILKVNPSDDSDMQSAIDEIIANDGHIDVLINAASFCSFKTTTDVSVSEGNYRYEQSVSDWERIIELALPYMEKQRSGKIIDVTLKQQKFNKPLVKYHHTAKNLLKPLNVSMQVDKEFQGITTILLKTTMQSEFLEVQNKFNFKGMYSKFQDKMEIFKMALLRDKMTKELENNILADLVLTTIKSDSYKNYQSEHVKVIPAFLRKIYIDRKATRSFIKEFA